MKKHLLILLIIACLGACEEIAEDCLEEEDSDIEECQETEYQSYIDCVRRRSKRSVGCGQNSCDSCDCNYCSTNICNSHCNACCGNFQQPCETKYCCYKTCHSQCSNDGCRDSCRRTCTDKLTNTKETIIQQQSPQVPNITTIINLHNKINNTNIIDVPINLRTDNINNITIHTGQYSNKTDQQKCCQVVSPRQCTPTKEFPFMKCFHLRKRVCSSICSANIMHAQPHQVCDQSADGSQADCHNQVIYIPQPQPRCVYKSDWPYVSCNIPPANCEGCYDHYATNTPRPANCPSSCYDDGYGVGPYYRQGPMYRPGYAPVPSCVQMGNCPYNLGYGYPPMAGGGGYDPMYPEYNPVPMPYSGVGYPPSTYDNFYSVQRNLEVPDLSKLLVNFTQNDDFDAQTLPITNSITHSSRPQPDPRLVKIETVNATDVFMTIKEMNDQPVLEDNDITDSPTSVYSTATLNPPGVQALPAAQTLPGAQALPGAQTLPGLQYNLGPNPVVVQQQGMQPTTILHPETGKIDPFGGIAAYDPIVRYQRDHNKVKEEDPNDATTTSSSNSTNVNELKNSTITANAKDLIPDESKKSGNLNHITITPIKKGKAKM